MDITAQRLAEEVLEQIRRQNELILDSVGDGIVVLDMEGRVTFANPAALKMLGWSLQDLVGRYFHSTAHHSKIDGAHYPEEECLICFHMNVTMFKMEDEVFWSKDGASFPIESVSTPVIEGEETLGTVIVFKDITERKQIEKDRLLLATAIEQAAESILITDQNGIIQYVNPAFESISSYEAMEVVGRQAGILRKDGDDQEVCTALREVLHRGEVWRGRFTDRRKDGVPYELDGTISPVRDTGGNITNFVAVRRDITHEARIERQLRQAQKMEAIGTFAGGIAHDFNNILMAIIGYTEMVIGDTMVSEPARTRLKQVLNASFRARELVKQILTFCRQGEQERKPTLINPIVKEAIKFLRASLPTTIEIREHIPSNLGSILADPVQMHQVLMNLCSNAAHAMRERGGVLQIGLIDMELGAEDTGRYPQLKPGAYQKLTVSDTGYGMDHATLERIFEPFFTTKKQGEGTGMGLSVVHGIVKNHGGVISVYSEPGEGTSFHMLFPRVGTKVSEEPQDRRAIPTGTERILLIDDEELLVEIEQEVLERLGYEVTAKSNSLEALELFRARPDLFDLVITDQTMPKMTGIELAKELLSTRADIPIILCTGFTELMTPEEARAMGIREFLMKPVVKRQLAEAVRSVLDRAPHYVL